MSDWPPFDYALASVTLLEEIQLGFGGSFMRAIQTLPGSVFFRHMLWSPESPEGLQPPRSHYAGEAT